MDLQTLLLCIKWYKDQQLNNDQEGDVDEYLDAFVALGGQPDKDGFISKDVLVEIIKTEFELTIDMVVSLSYKPTNIRQVHCVALRRKPHPLCVCLSAGLLEGHRWRH